MLEMEPIGPGRPLATRSAACGAAWPVNSSIPRSPSTRDNVLKANDKSLHRARQITQIFDNAFRVPGTRFRFGIDPLLGLLPGVGDVIGGSFSAYLVWLAARAGAPVPVLGRMIGYIGLDTLFGAIPLLGDLMDAAFKANVRNMQLIERYATDPSATTRTSKGMLAGLLVALLVVLVLCVWIAYRVLAALADLVI